MAFLTPGFRLPQPPRRIVSLVPSQTELLYHLGLEAETVGITRFCIHPGQWFRSKTRVGGTKSIHLDKVASLQPDLILANKEENVQDQVIALNNVAPVWVSDIGNLGHALAMIRDVGSITDRLQQAAGIAADIEAGFGALQPARPLRALYLIWRDPWMTIGSDTFIHDMMQRAGLDNCYADARRYPAITAADIAARDPQVVLLSSEPYPFKEKHMAELQTILPQAMIRLVDGELFSWYGSRLLHTPAYLQQLQESLGQ